MNKGESIKSRLRVIFDHKSYYFLLAPINVKSVEPKFHRCGVTIQEVIRLQNVTFRVFRLHFIFLGNSVFVLFFA